MNPQQIREISTGILLRIGTPACISIGAVVAVVFADGALPAWLRAGIIAFGVSLFVLSVVVLIIEYLRQEADLKLELEIKRSRLPRVAYIPTKLPDPKDGGETPMPEFLSVVFETWYASKKDGQLGKLPAVRSEAFIKLGLNPSRVQAMYTRCATWGMIVGRVQGGAAGIIADGWTHAQARQFMIAERPEYGVSIQG